MKIIARVRVHAVLDEDGELSGKVTAHAPYADKEDMVDETQPIPECSTEVELSELPAALQTKVSEVLAELAAAAQSRLETRLQDAVFTTRSVAIVRGEIKR